MLMKRNKLGIPIYDKNTIVINGVFWWENSISYDNNDMKSFRVINHNNFGFIIRKFNKINIMKTIEQIKRDIAIECGEENFDLIFESEILVGDYEQARKLWNEVGNRYINQYENQEKELSKRNIAMTWWNNLSSENKTNICNISTVLIGSPRRWESLTGREIEILYDIYKTFGNNV